jgi:glycosyltransferase involved in cell wall biosynthesis
LKKAKIVRGDKVLNIWPAVPTFPLGNRENLRRIHKIPKEAVVIGWLGRKVPIKRIDRILEIAAQQRELIFVIAGDGDSIHTTYSNFIQTNKLTNIIELGFTSPSELWAIADICLVTSDNEAMPISPIEASLAGRPIVAVDAGSTREVILDGKTGILCKKDVNQLSSAIGRLSKDSSLRSKMGEAARLFAVEKFSPETSVNRQLEGYRLAITRSSRSN